MIHRILFLTVILLANGTSTSSAQAVEEPPIPVMMICPYHEDSLRRAYESGLGGQTAFADSISKELVHSNEQLTQSVERSFTLVFILLGIMALITLAALRVAYRLKEEIREVRDERRIMPFALPEPRVVETTALSSTKIRKPSIRKRLRPEPPRARRTAPKRRR